MGVTKCLGLSLAWNHRVLMMMIAIRSHTNTMPLWAHLSHTQLLTRVITGSWCNSTISGGWYTMNVFQVRWTIIIANVNSHYINGVHSAFRELNLNCIYTALNHRSMRSSIYHDYKAFNLIWRRMTPKYWNRIVFHSIIFAHLCNGWQSTPYKYI